MNELLRKLLNLPVQASSIAPSIDALHYAVIGTALAGLLAVVLTLAVFSALHHETRRTPIRVPSWIEAVSIAGLLAMFLLFWLIGERQFRTLRTPPQNALTVYVVAKQWMWSFAYPDGKETNHELFVPARQPVKLVLASRDVIHSFFVPAFRIKQDALPGRSTLAWFEAGAEGSYEILCAEYCGTSHSHMRGFVRVLSPENYARWLEAEDDAPRARPLASAHDGDQSLARNGERVASERGCLRCHTLDGTPHLGPTWAGMYRARVELTDGRRVVADEAYLTRSMMDPALEVRRGFPPIMPSYVGLLTPTDTASLVELIRSVAARTGPGAEPLPVATPEPPRLPVGPRDAAETSVQLHAAGARGSAREQEMETP